MSRTRRDDLLRRYRAVDRENPVVDRPRAEAALARHFAAGGYPEFPVRWASGLQEGRFLALEPRQGKLRALPPRRRLDPIRRPPIFTLATEHSTVTVDGYPLSREIRRASWSALESVLMGLQFQPTLHAWDLPRSAALGGVWTLAVGGDQAPIFEPLADAFEAGLWIYWVLPEVVVAVPLPAIREQGGRLHCEAGPAVSWPGGEQQWFIDGVRLSREWVLDFHRLTPARIREMENLEARRVLIRRYGEQRFLRDAGAKRIGRDEVGELYRLELPGDEPLVMVRVLNSTPEADGTSKPYLLRVPPGMRSAREAVAWTFGMEREAYAPEVET